MLGDKKWSNLVSIHCYYHEAYCNIHTYIYIYIYWWRWELSPISHTVLASQRTCTTRTNGRKVLREHRCDAGQKPSEGQVRSRHFTFLERKRGSINLTSISENVSPFIVVERWLFFLTSRSFQCGTIVVESRLFLLTSRSFQCGTMIPILQNVVNNDFPFWILVFFWAIEISDHGPIRRLSAMGLQSAWDHLYTGPTVPIRRAH